MDKMHGAIVLFNKSENQKEINKIIKEYPNNNDNKCIRPELSFKKFV